MKFWIIPLIFISSISKFSKKFHVGEKWKFFSHGEEHREKFFKIFFPLCILRGWQISCVFCTWNIFSRREKYSHRAMAVETDFQDSTGKIVLWSFSFYEVLSTVPNVSRNILKYIIVAPTDISPAALSTMEHTLWYTLAYIDKLSQFIILFKHSQSFRTQLIPKNCTCVYFSKHILIPPRIQFCHWGKSI